MQKILSCLRSLVQLLPNTLKLFGFPNIWILSVPIECYSRNASCALNLISTFLFTKTASFR